MYLCDHPIAVAVSIASGVLLPLVAEISMEQVAVALGVGLVFLALTLWAAHEQRRTQSEASRNSGPAGTRKMILWGVICALAITALINWFSLGLKCSSAGAFGCAFAELFLLTVAGNFSLKILRRPLGDEIASPA